MADETQTVEVGGTEVEIIETEDGFEAREAETGPEPGLYLKARSKKYGGDDGLYGFMIPLDADFFCRMSEGSPDRNNYVFAWNTDDCVDDWGPLANGAGQRDADKHGFDGHAAVAEPEIVVVE